jgi:hypothetical protein
MADIQTQISEARKAGYDDAAIAAHLTEMPEYGSKMKTALDAGYKPAEILSHLTSSAKTPVSEIPKARGAAGPGLITLLNPLAGAYGLAEAGTNLATGLGASAVGGLRGLYSLATGDTAAEAARKTQATQDALTYTPRSAPGAAAARVVALPMELAAQGVGAVGGKIGGLMGNEALGQTIGENLPAVAATIAGGPAALRAGRNVGQTMAAERAATQLEQSRLNAASIETAQKAADMGLALNPAVSNPTKANRAKGMLIGNADVNTSISKANDLRVIEIVKGELGLPQTIKKLDQAAYNTAREQISPPYNAIRAIPALTDDTGAVVQQLRNLQSDPLIGGKNADKKITALIDEAIDTVSAGRSGKRILDDIEQLRQDANNIYGSLERPDRIQRSVADASKGIANALEGLIDQHLTRVGNTTLLKDFQAARPRMAQTYAYEKATDFNTGRVDALALAKITRGDNSFTGRLADLGQVAGTFPEAFAGGTPTSFARRHLTRSGPAGTAGFALGLLAGSPFAGGIIGAGLGELGGMVGAKRIASRKYQEANAVPTDYRPLREAMGYNNLANVNALAIAPEWSPSSAAPGTAPPTQAGNQFTLGEYRPPQPPTQMTMASIDYPGYPKQPVDIVRRYQEGAEAAQRAAEAAGRQPTGRGVMFDRDPVTGGLVPVQTSGAGGVIGGMTPLQSAVDKLSSHATTETATTFGRYRAGTGAKGDPRYRVRQTGQTETYGTADKAFALSAEERIAWDKTKAGLESAAPGLSKLSDKNVADKMMDRAWVQSTVDKARQQAQLFDQISQRAANADKARQAAMQREILLAAAEDIEAGLAARPVGKSSQGPKTRAAQRLNQLAPEEAVIVTPRNNLPR